MRTMPIKIAVRTSPPLFVFLNRIMGIVYPIIAIYASKLFTDEHILDLRSVWQENARAVIRMIWLEWS